MEHCHCGRMPLQRTDAVEVTHIGVSIEGYHQEGVCLQEGCGYRLSLGFHYTGITLDRC